MVMSKINTVEEAVEKAESLIDKYYYFRKLERVQREQSEWVVSFDVSVIGPKVSATVKINADTGEIVEYTTDRE